MGTIHLPEPVKFFAAITFAPFVDFEKLLDRLQSLLGAIDVRSPAIDFSFTRYYEKEMGPDLRKQWVGFEKLRDPAELAEIKTQTNQIESEFSESGRRPVNLDPGYIEKAKMVLASTKNFSHRIYLERGIYADLQYRFRRGAFTFLEWTYPDYQSETAVRFFEQLRRKYVKQVEEKI